MGIWLIVLALVFNGLSAYADVDLTDAPATSGQNHSTATHNTDCADHIATGVTHGGHHLGLVHNHLKCCARCSMVSLLPGAILVPATFPSGDAVFYTAQHHLVGHTVASDPHIPKPVV